MSSGGKKSAANTAPRTEPDKVSDHLFAAGIQEIEAASALLSSDPENDRSTRRALFEAARGIELVVKSMIAGVHWSHVFDDPGKASLDALHKGEFKSATVDDSLARLKRLTGFSLSDTAREKLQVLRSQRNEYEHFGWPATALALRGAMAAALHVLVEAINQAVGESILPDSCLTACTGVVSQLAEFAEFNKKRMIVVTSGLSIADLYECPKCLQRAGAIEDGLDCRFCYAHSTPEVAADHFVSSTLGLSRYEVAKDGGEWPISECPECDQSALVRILAVEGEGGRGFVCFGCGEDWNIDALSECARCPRMMTISARAESSVCSDCWSAEMSRD